MSLESEVAALTTATTDLLEAVAIPQAALDAAAGLATTQVGLDSCSVRYLPGQNWWSLKHELSHCQGYEDHGIPLQFGTYTPEQQAIMDKEGVKKWTQTSVYQTGITR